MTIATGSKGTVAGVLDIFAGAMALVGAAILAGMGVIASGAIAAAPKDVGPLPALPLVIFVPLAALVLVMAVLAIAGGIAALRRSSYTWAVVGAVAATLACLPLGAVALVVTILAEDEFRPGATG